MSEMIEFKKALQEIGINEYDKLSDITGHTPHSLRVMLGDNKKLPRWCKLALYALKNSNKKVKIDSKKTLSRAL